MAGNKSVMGTFVIKGSDAIEGGATGVVMKREKVSLTLTLWFLARSASLKYVVRFGTDTMRSGLDLTLESVLVECSERSED